MAACAAAPQSFETEQEPADSRNDCVLWEDLNLDEIESFTLPLMNAQALAEQDQDPPKDAPLRFAESVEVEISPHENGTWSSPDGVRQIWRLRIVSPGALSVNLGFTDYRMPAGGCLYIYPPDRQIVLGPYTEQDNEEHGQLWTPVIEGEELIIEVTLHTEAIPQLRLIIGYINSGYKQ